MMCASATQRSGPMPAGSPLVTASRCSSRVRGTPVAWACSCFIRAVSRSALVGTQFNVGAIAKLSHPLLIRFIRFPRTQRLACGKSLAFLGHILVASLQHLDQVPAERRLDRRAAFTG